jgi:hypothetical protein
LPRATIPHAAVRSTTPRLIRGQNFNPAGLDDRVHSHRAARFGDRWTSQERRGNRRRQQERENDAGTCAPYVRDSDETRCDRNDRTSTGHSNFQAPAIPWPTEDPTRCR